MLCTGSNPATTCSYPCAIAIPATGVSQFISIRHLKFYRDNDLLNKKVTITVNINIVSTTSINIDILFGEGGML